MNFRYLGVMQGRLLPPETGKFQCFPRQRWADEFPLAADCELDAIEWIYDFWGKDVNPITSDSGIREMKSLCDRHRVVVVSMCADYFMENPFVRASSEEKKARLQCLSWLMSRCQQVGITRIVLPFVDNSAILTQAETEDVIAIIRDALPIAVAFGVEIHLETSLPPREFALLLSKLPDQRLAVNYDTGNSASLGYDVAEELSAYGDRIGSVHIKDRLRGGSTVPLGYGSADIKGFLAGLERLGYRGDLILQAARGESGREVAWVRNNRDILRSYIDKSVRPQTVEYAQ
jgi:L-ribulose-5-phosphate 3-epimerase